MSYPFSLVKVLLTIFATGAFAELDAYYLKHYDTLRLDRTASTEDIKRAFRKLAFEAHPDKNVGDNTAVERFVELSAAYEVLVDEEKRKLYDLGGLRPVVPEGTRENQYESAVSVFRQAFDIFDGFNFADEDKKEELMSFLKGEGMDSLDVGTAVIEVTDRKTFTMPHTNKKVGLPVDYLERMRSLDHLPPDVAGRIQAHRDKNLLRAKRVKRRDRQRKLSHFVEL